MKVQRTQIGDEPASVAEVKRYLRVDYDDDDQMIETMIRSSRLTLESRMNISIPLHVVRLEWPDYAPPDNVPYGPAVEWETLTVDGADQEPPSDDVLRFGKGALSAEYTAGYDVVPDDLKMAVMRLVKVDYDGEGDREQIIGTVKHYNRNPWF
jgi:hypothetical protein